MIREAVESDLQGLLELYLHLHETGVPEDSGALRDTWRQIMSDPNRHVIVDEADGRLVASCVCVVVPNLTRGLRSYALVENVVTHSDYRRQGRASACLNRAREIAVGADCYKLMLLTGSKSEGTLQFYRKCGYRDGDKTAFVQWLESHKA